MAPIEGNPPSRCAVAACASAARSVSSSSPTLPAHYLSNFLGPGSGKSTPKKLTPVQHYHLKANCPSLLLLGFHILSGDLSCLAGIQVLLTRCFLCLTGIHLVLVLGVFRFFDILRLLLSELHVLLIHFSSLAFRQVLLLVQQGVLLVLELSFFLHFGLLPFVLIML